MYEHHVDMCYIRIRYLITIVVATELTGSNGTESAFRRN